MPPDSSFECGCVIGDGAEAPNSCSGAQRFEPSVSVGAEDFGHAPEGFVKLDIFIDAFDGLAFAHSSPIRPAARVVALAAADNVFLDLCGASRYVEQPVTAASVAR